MFERFTRESKEVLTRASSTARELRHGYIGTEHILLGLEGTAAAELLGGLGAPLDALREPIAERVGVGTGAVTGSPPFTARAKKALELSLREALARNDAEIMPEHLLLGLLREGDGLAAEVLVEAGITHDAVKAALGPMSARPSRRWRPTLRLGGVPPRVVEDVTPGAQAALLRARTLAGTEPTSTYHLLMTLLEEGVAGRILEALGVTRPQVAEKFAELGSAGTSDEIADVSVEVGGKQYKLRPEEAARLQQLLDLGPQERGRKLGEL